jgi:hypothetical protein
MQVIHDSNAGGRLGEALGTGLNQLAQHKLAQISKQYQDQQERFNFAQGLKSSGLPENIINLLANIDPKDRGSILKNLNPQALMQGSEQSSQQQMGGMGSGMQQLEGQQQPQQQQFGPEQLLQALRQPEQLYGKQSNMFQQQEPGQQIQQQQLPQQQQMAPDKAKLAHDLFTSPKEKREREKLELAKRTANIKETKQYVDELKGKEKAVKEADLRLRKMETLIDKGNLPNAALWSALSKLESAPFISGLTAPLAELMKGGVKWWSGKSSDIEEFEKLSSEFVKNAKQYFGSRITQKEVEMFMQTVPTLMQTDSGKKRLIENIRSLNELTQIEAKAARSIIKGNGGVAPIDIEQQVQDKIGNKLDKVAKKFAAR